MTTKKIISTICASVFAFSCFGFNASAKVIEPEIVKTETWITSYSIGAYVYDGEESGLYSGYQCECMCDIYSNGCIYVYIEYNNLPSNSMNIRLDETVPIKNSGCFKYSSLLGQEYNVDKVFGNNFYPDHYDIEYNSFIRFDNYGNDSNKNYKYFYAEPTGYINGFGLVRSDCFPNAHIITDTSKPETLFKFQDRTINTYIIKLFPLYEVTTDSNFRLFGHDITITPELLSGNIVAETELTEQEKYIKQLEEENSKLKTEIESYKKLDFDGDGLLTNADAQMILVYYTNSLVGKTTGKVEDYSEYVKQISG